MIDLLGLIVAATVGLAAGRWYVRKQQIGRLRPTLRLLVGNGHLPMLYRRTRTAVRRADAASADFGGGAVVGSALPELTASAQAIADRIVVLSRRDRTEAALHAVVGDVQLLERVSREVTTSAVTIGSAVPSSVRSELEALGDRLKATREALAELDAQG